MREEVPRARKRVEELMQAHERVEAWIDERPWSALAVAIGACVREARVLDINESGSARMTEAVDEARVARVDGRFDGRRACACGQRDDRQHEDEATAHCILQARAPSGFDASTPSQHSAPNAATADMTTSGVS